MSQRCPRRASPACRRRRGTRIEPASRPRSRGRWAGSRWAGSRWAGKGARTGRQRAKLLMTAPAAFSSAAAAFGRLLHLQRQPVHPFAHVGPADRQPHSNPARNRDHRRASASTTAAANAGGTKAGIRTRALPGNSISPAIQYRRQFNIECKDCRCGNAIASGRHQHLRQAIRRCPQIPTPAGDQARRHIGLPSHIPHHGTGSERRRHNRLLLLDAPPAAPRGTNQHFDACHRTVSCAGAKHRCLHH